MVDFETLPTARTWILVGVYDGATLVFIKSEDDDVWGSSHRLLDALLVFRQGIRLAVDDAVAQMLVTFPSAAT